MFVISKYPFGTTYALMSDSDRKNHCHSRAAYIERIIARIGRDKPIFRDDYARIGLNIAIRLSLGVGLSSTLRSMQISSMGMYEGCGIGRFMLIDGIPRFEANNWQMEPDRDQKEPYSLIAGKKTFWFDFYICDGCSKTKDSKKDPAKTEYGYDHYKFRLGDKSISMNCCKKCRAEIRRISRETLELSKNRTLINQLKREIQNGAN